MSELKTQNGPPTSNQFIVHTQNSVIFKLQSRERKIPKKWAHLKEFETFPICHGKD